MDFSFAFAANSAVCWVEQSLAELLPLSPGKESLCCAERRESGSILSGDFSHCQSPAPLPLGECIRVQEKEGRQDTGQPAWSRGRNSLSPHPLVKEHSSKSSCFSYCPVLTWVSPSEYAEMKRLQFLGWGLILQQDKWMIYAFNTSTRNHPNLEISSASCDRIAWQYSEWINLRQVDLLMPFDRNN